MPIDDLESFCEMRKRLVAEREALIRRLAEINHALGFARANVTETRNAASSNLYGEAVTMAHEFFTQHPGATMGDLRTAHPEMTRGGLNIVYYLIREGKLEARGERRHRRYYPAGHVETQEKPP